MKYRPNVLFNLLLILGLSLLFGIWLTNPTTEDFIFLLFLTVMSLFRMRFKASWMTYTLIVDLLLTVFFLHLTHSHLARHTVHFVLFQTMYGGMFTAILLILYLIFILQPIYLVLSFGMMLCGLMLNFWTKERHLRMKDSDSSKLKYYEVEQLNQELEVALAKIEQMTIIAERSRISKDIHDKAGHEIVAASITFQTVRELMTDVDPELLELYDLALKRLKTGTNGMREAVHNLSTVTFMGVDRMGQICENFPTCQVNFTASGDTSELSTSIWHGLEACLKESLTNVTKHAYATFVRVELDVTPYLIRLMIENDGVKNEVKPLGSGLRNLTQRMKELGGHLSIRQSETFSVICVIPRKGK